MPIIQQKYVSANAFISKALYSDSTTVVWTPDSSDTVVDTLHWLDDLLVRFSTGISQKLCLLNDLPWLQVSDTNCFLAPIDVVAFDDRVLAWTWGNVDFDLGVLPREFGKGGLEEGAAICIISTIYLQ